MGGSRHALLAFATLVFALSAILTASSKKENTAPGRRQSFNKRESNERKVKEEEKEAA